MAKDTDKVELTPGTITLTDSHGRKTSHAIASLLRATDIPTGLTYAQVGAISTLASLVVVLVRTLIHRGVLDDSFLEKGEYDLATIIEVLENMGADFGVPDITTTPAV